MPLTYQRLSEIAHELAGRPGYKHRRGDNNKGWRSSRTLMPTRGFEVSQSAWTDRALLRQRDDYILLEAV
jgi:hypothetical protein